MSMYSLWTWSVQPFGPALPHYINMEQSVDMVSSAFGPALLHYINMEQSVDVPWSIQPFGPALPPLHKHGTAFEQDQFSYSSLITHFFKLRNKTKIFGFCSVPPWIQKVKVKKTVSKADSSELRSYPRFCFCFGTSYR